MNTLQMKKYIADGGINATLTHIYGEAAIDMQKARYSAAIDEFAAIYGADREITLYSVAGRSELSGNHTDHNCGCVVAASIDLDIIAVASKRDDNVIAIKSEGFPEDVVDFASYNAPVESKFGSSASIIAGMVQGFLKDGYAVGGFDAYTTSNVLKGSGLSSSAAFEDMVGNILSHMYNDGKVDNVEIAKLAQYAENVFFGKPCGLMDQVACAVGGIVAIDFKDPKAPVINKVDFDISAAGYNLCIVNTGGNHADLTDDYAAIRVEMNSVAEYFGKSVLREVEPADVFANMGEIRKKTGDRALERAIHFYNENSRVERLTSALDKEDFDEFKSIIIESGKSSYMYNQNCFTLKNPDSQPVALALCLTEELLKGKAAYRVHGGGFAGTIQVFLPKSEIENYTTQMKKVFGENSCYILSVRSHGGCEI